MLATFHAIVAKNIGNIGMENLRIGAFFHWFRPSKQGRSDESCAQQPQVGGQISTSATAVLGERT
jgi:hypothetical protein